MRPNRKVIDTRDEARKMFVVFHDRDPAREVEMRWSWPSKMCEAGVGVAEMYSSNKWKSNLRDREDYKHVAEGPRMTYVRPGWIRDWGNPQAPISLRGASVAFEPPMPKHFAILGRLKGVQLRLFEIDSAGKIYLPKGDENLYEVRVAHGMLGGARHPKTGEAFVFVYTPDDGVAMIMTGRDLEIGKDGIAG